MAKPKKAAGKTIVVKQIGSPIRRPKVQRQTLIGLGLNKMHRTRELPDTPSIRGMVRPNANGWVNHVPFVAGSTSLAIRGSDISKIKLSQVPDGDITYTWNSKSCTQ